jgi:serine/threonine-protein kinase
VIPQPLGSHYLLVERIGQGSMGVVWRARDLATGNLCAVKLLQPEYAADPAIVSRFVRERTALVTLQHPNVVTLHDMIVEGERLGLVMDLITGGDLAAHRHRHGGRLAAGEASELTAQICDGLAAAHAAGIMHRDLKPANVLLEDGQVRLADFGIARIADLTSITASGFVMGTAAYLAPEVIRGQQPSPACDVYAVGVTLYELLAGEPPFTGHVAAIMHGHLESEPARPDGMPDRLWELIAVCLSKDPADRPSAANVAQALHIMAQAPGCNTPLPATGTVNKPSPGSILPPAEQSAVPPELAPERAAGSSLRRLLRAAGRTRVVLSVCVLAIAVVSAAFIISAATGSDRTGTVQAPSGPSWRCGLPVPATLYHGQPTGQTIQACIRTYHGLLDLYGVLTGTRNGWKERVVLILKAPGHGKQQYASPICTTSTCVYKISVKPASGSWAVSPVWERYNNMYYQSTGDKSPSVVY